MPSDILCRAVPGGFMALNGAEASKVDQFKGKEVQVRISIPRNIRFHRKFFALLHVGLEMCDTEYNPEQYRALCIAGAGHCDFIESGGHTIAVPKSISFAKMSEDEFERLYNDVLNFICSTWVLDDAQLNQIVNFM